MPDAPAARYHLSYETRPGRCAWCWSPLPAAQSHAVVRAAAGRPLELRFHHTCWPVYRGLSGIEGRELKALYREWTPQRVEALRLHAGLNLTQLAAKLGIGKERLTRYLSGQLPRLGQKAVARLRGLAVDTRFERQEQGGGLIDWDDRRAVFSLCMHCGWTAGELARRLGVRDGTVTAWWDRGCPRQSVRHWNALNQLAREHHFDAGMLVDDRLWTPELARAAVEQSGLTQAAFAAAAGCFVSLIRDAVLGRRRVNRAMAYSLTRAAARLNLPLPLVGRIEPLRRAPRPFPGGLKGPQGGRVWRPEELALLGTVPDREVVARLGTRSHVAVMRMRRELGIPRVPWRGWDGTPRACPVPLPDVLRRYYSRLGMEPPR
jgi:transcriptional regulator with XRE-family HTH domain